MNQEILQAIYEKIQSKGWNMYSNEHDLGPKETIPNNLVNHLEPNSKYVLLPNADNPRDVEQVLQAVESMAISRNREMPTISLRGYNQPITGFTTFPRWVKVHTPQGSHVTYQEFYEALESMVQINT